MLPTPSKLTNALLTDAEYLKKCLKESLIGRCKDFMSTDWLPVDADESKSFPVQVCYTEPCWTRTCKGGVEDKQVKYCYRPQRSWGKVIYFHRRL